MEPSSDVRITFEHQPVPRMREDVGDGIFTAGSHRTQRDTGPSPSSGLVSTIAGILLLGEIRRNYGAYCSPFDRLTGMSLWAILVSSRKSRIFWPFGVAA
jgi:hypothetical protein